MQAQHKSFMYYLMGCDGSFPSAGIFLWRGIPAEANAAHSVLPCYQSHKFCCTQRRNALQCSPLSHSTTSWEAAACDQQPAKPPAWNKPTSRHPIALPKASGPARNCHNTAGSALHLCRAQTIISECNYREVTEPSHSTAAL